MNELGRAAQWSRKTTSRIRLVYFIEPVTEYELKVGLKYLVAVKKPTQSLKLFHNLEVDFRRQQAVYRIQKIM